MTDFSDEELHTKPVTFMGARVRMISRERRQRCLVCLSTAGFTLFGSDPDKARLQYADNRIWCGGIIRNSPTSTLSNAPALLTAVMSG